MYLGNVMEIADKKALYEDAKHPYTQALLSLSRFRNMDIEYNKIHLEGDVPSPFNPPQAAGSTPDAGMQRKNAVFRCRN